MKVTLRMINPSRQMISATGCLIIYAGELMIQSRRIIRRTGRVIIQIGRMTLPMNGVSNSTDGLGFKEPIADRVQIVPIEYHTQPPPLLITRNWF